ncbi:hypothetical protein GSI_11801 [Ganoderma sinense ZZ0214-1]|uniref:Survival protein SurE-like phosphatase/nucleotidase domain-containing protein n=1 Tax=Ganoderma sinense ZZ0214-1 TaxID=1077348 RepID=A0A2G8RX26_9APHY|nr:hypothetical protein GSI_11801 [Ganoderma sinense ZZ0214-1]
MHSWSRLIGAVSFLLFPVAFACNVVITNGDGWAVAQIRAQRDSLIHAGFDVILSAPPQDLSSTGSDSAPPKPLTRPCQFNTCSTGSPAEGFNASDRSTQSDTVYGPLSPKLFHSPPDFVISGPNVGNVLGRGTIYSGTVGAAAEAVKEGIPAAAFAAGTAAKVSYTTLTTAPRSPDTLSAHLYAELTTNFTCTLVDPAACPILPAGVTLKINYSPTTFSASGGAIGNCARASDFKWVLTRMQASAGAVDVATCGSRRLPVEETVVDAGCYATVAVVNATTTLDVGADAQEHVLNRLAPSGLLSCFRG